MQTNTIHTEALISVSALQHNIQRIRELVPRSHILAMVKANAYGHGLVNVANILQQQKIDALGVAHLHEAMVLRAANIEIPIVVMQGFYDATELLGMQEQDLQPVIHRVEQVEMLEKCTFKRAQKPLIVWLKIDTGMHRLGFEPGVVRSIWQRLRECSSVNLDIRLMTHLACADDLDHPLTLKQIQSFEQVTQGLPGMRSIANSAAIFNWPQTHQHWIRPGIMIYGISPLAAKNGVDLGLQPVMTLCSRLIAIREVRRGESVGYAATWTCPEASESLRVGTIAIGYGDGYPWQAPQGASVLVNGKVAKLIGRVSMDMISVDLQNLPTVQVGDSVVLWGDGLPLEVLARQIKTIPYTLPLGLTSRVKRLAF